jgi:Xaa-Pro aminopeptidase
MPWIKEMYPIPIMEEDGLIESAVSTTFKQIFQRHSLEKGRIGLDALSFSIFESYRRNFPGANFVSCEMLLKDARMTKTFDEIRLINEATAMTEAGLASAIEKTKPGVTEYEVASEYMRVIFALGSETLHTAQPYVTSGEHLSPPFRLATDKRIRYGDLVFMDTGACFNGYFSDIGRTVICGKASEKQKEIYRVVYESLMASLKAVRPRAKASDVARACRERAAEFGYDRHFLLLFIGHGIGVAPAEPPFIGEPTVPGAREVELKPGMVLAIEPLIYVPGVKGGGGVRIEDVVLVTEVGSEVLSRFPYDEELLK